MKATYLGNGIVKLQDARVSEGKCLEKHTLTITLDFNGVENEDLYLAAAKSEWIRLQKIREKGDEAAKALHNSTVKVTAIDDMVGGANGESGLIKQLQNLGLSKEQAERIVRDPAKREQALKSLKSMFA